jgi:hypothetical protein
LTNTPVENIDIGIRVHVAFDPEVSNARISDATPDHHFPSTALLFRLTLMRQILLLLVLVVVLLAEGANATDDALIREHHVLPVFACPMNVLFANRSLFAICSCVNFGLLGRVYTRIPS